MSGSSRAGIVIAALAGGVVGGLVSHVVLCPASRVGASTLAPLDVDRLRLRGADGTTLAELAAPGNGGAVLNLLSARGDLRLQLGTYDGSVVASEKGLPLIGLSDNSQRLRLLLRVAGKNESPVLVFKDTRGATAWWSGSRLPTGARSPSSPPSTGTGRSICSPDSTERVPPHRIALRDADVPHACTRTVHTLDLARIIAYNAIIDHQRAIRVDEACPERQRSGLGGFTAHLTLRRPDCRHRPHHWSFGRDPERERLRWLRRGSGQSLERLNSPPRGLGRRYPLKRVDGPDPPTGLLPVARWE